MKSQSGITDYDMLLPLVIVVILVAVAIPNFFQARDRARRTGCMQALGTLRKAMTMYATENPKHIYPLELRKKTFSYEPDAKLICAFCKYTHVTNVLRDCSEISFDSVMSKNYTITAIAKDRNKTLLTATVDTIIQP